MRNILKHFLSVSLVILLIFFASCTSPKKVIYFNDIQDTASIKAIGAAKSVFESKIQKSDQLWITVGGSNPLDLVALNSANGTVTGGGASSAGNSNNSILGFLVEADGNIQLPYVGKLKAEGLTRIELQDTLTELFKSYTKNPVVNVRFLNYSYSVIGEVNRSGRFNMTTERITLLEAISTAGDITEFGRRENILIIREEGGERKYARVNLLSKDIFTSPYFYLKTNDVVYIEPVKARFITRTGIPQYLAVIAIALSLIITVVNISK
jgi:polysaccharide export outer membrane protein